jgi:AcrR family transcriptional regulator
LVADAAQITPGTIYHYFANKQGLFLAAHEEIQRSLIDTVDAAVTPEQTFSEAIDHMLRALLAVYIEHPTWMRFTSVVRIEARRNPEISAAQNDEAWRDLFRRLAEKGVASGEIAASDRRAIQTVLSAMVLGLTQHGIEAEVTDHVECVRGFGMLLRGSLLTHQGAGRR